MFAPVSRLLRKAPFGALRRLERSRRDPAAAQARTLRRLLRRAADTEWGRRLGFRSLAREDDVVSAYRDAVPLLTYEHLHADIERVRQGESDILWPGRVRYFAQSSGTTRKSKVTPLTDELMRMNMRFGASMVAAHAVATGSLRVLRGHRVYLGGRVLDDPDHPGMRVGSVSGVIADYAHRESRLVRWLPRRAVPVEVHRTRGLAGRLEAIVQGSVDRDVRLVSAGASWILWLFRRLIETYNERHGARVSTVAEIWPHLSLVIASTVPLSAYRRALDELIGKPDVGFVENYTASEGFLAHQTDPRDPAMELLTDAGIFLELIRLDEHGGRSPRRFWVGDAETGVRYVPVLTTCGGLWAYDLGDIIRFTSLSPPRLEVLGRTVEKMDSYGEEIFGDQARAAVAEACARTGGAAPVFHMSPLAADARSPHRLQWLVEFAGRVPDVAAFARALDSALQRINPAYAGCRQRDFGPSEVVALPPDTFRRYLQVSRGDAFDVQTKVPCLSDDRVVAEGVFDLLAGTVATSARPEPDGSEADLAYTPGP